MNTDRSKLFKVFISGPLFSELLFESINALSHSEGLLLGHSQSRENVAITDVDARTVEQQLFITITDSLATGVRGSFYGPDLGVTSRTVQESVASRAGGECIGFYKVFRNSRKRCDLTVGDKNLLCDFEKMKVFEGNKIPKLFLAISICDDDVILDVKYALHFIDGHHISRQQMLIANLGDTNHNEYRSCPAIHYDVKHVPKSYQQGGADAKLATFSAVADEIEKTLKAGSDRIERLQEQLHVATAKRLSSGKFPNKEPNLTISSAIPKAVDRSFDSEHFFSKPSSSKASSIRSHASNNSTALTHDDFGVPIGKSSGSSVVDVDLSGYPGLGGRSESGASSRPANTRYSLRSRKSETETPVDDYVYNPADFEDPLPLSTGAISADFPKLDNNDEQPDSFTSDEWVKIGGPASAWDKKLNFKDESKSPELFDQNSPPSMFVDERSRRSKLSNSIGDATDGPAESFETTDAKDSTFVEFVDDQHFLSAHASSWEEIERTEMVIENEDGSTFVPKRVDAEIQGQSSSCPGIPCDAIGSVSLLDSKGDSYKPKSTVLNESVSNLHIDEEFCCAEPMEIAETVLKTESQPIRVEKKSKVPKRSSRESTPDKHSVDLCARNAEKPVSESANSATHSGLSGVSAKRTLDATLANGVVPSGAPAPQIQASSASSSLKNKKLVHEKNIGGTNNVTKKKLPPGSGSSSDEVESAGNNKRWEDANGRPHAVGKNSGGGKGSGLPKKSDISSAKLSSSSPKNNSSSIVATKSSNNSPSSGGSKGSVLNSPLSSSGSRGVGGGTVSARVNAFNTKSGGNSVDKVRPLLVVAAGSVGGKAVADGGGVRGSSSSSNQGLLKPRGQGRGVPNKPKN